MKSLLDEAVRINVTQGEGAVLAWHAQLSDEDKAQLSREVEEMAIRIRHVFEAWTAIWAGIATSVLALAKSVDELNEAVQRNKK